MRLRLTTCLAAIAALSIAAPAAAQSNLDRVQVGVPGTVTRKFSPSLSLRLTIPSGYTRTCCYDFVSGHWAGPPIHFSGDASRTGTSSTVWEASFKRTKRSLRSVARGAGWAGYPQVSANAAKVGHVLAGRSLGKLKAYTVIDQEAAPRARAQAALVIDLGHRVKAIVLFTISDPDANTSSSGDETVNGTSASAWNREQAKRALKSVAVEGALPIQRVHAQAKGRRVAGTVTDSAGQRVGQAKLVLQKRKGGRWRQVRKGKSSLKGAFSLRSAGAGSYRVVATIGGTSARSAAVRVR